MSDRLAMALRSPQPNSAALPGAGERISQSLDGARTVPFSVYLDQRLSERLKAYAGHHRRSISAQVVIFIKAGLDARTV